MCHRKQENVDINASVTATQGKCDSKDLSGFPLGVSIFSLTILFYKNVWSFLTLRVRPLKTVQCSFMLISKKSLYFFLKSGFNFFALKNVLK